MNGLFFNGLSFLFSFFRFYYETGLFQFELLEASFIGFCNSTPTHL